MVINTLLETYVQFRQRTSVINRESIQQLLDEIVHIAGLEVVDEDGIIDLLRSNVGVADTENGQGANIHSAQSQLPSEEEDGEQGHTFVCTLLEVKDLGVAFGAGYVKRKIARVSIHYVPHKNKWTIQPDWLGAWMYYDSEGHLLFRKVGSYFIRKADPDELYNQAKDVPRLGTEKGV